MARQGKAGVQVRAHGDVVEISFWGSRDGVPSRLYTERLVKPRQEDIATLVESKITELRTARGK